MKYRNKIKISALLILIAVLVFAPRISFADGTCMLPSLGSGGAATTGYTEQQCEDDGGVWNGGTTGSATTTTTSTQTGTGANLNPSSGTPPPVNSGSTASSAATPPGGLVPCTNTFDSSGAVTSPCGFNQLITLVNTVVKFILFAMAVPISAIMFAYAGFLLVTSAGSTEARSKAKRIFTNVAIGLIIALAAWLIIELILKTIGFDGSWIGF